MSRLISSRLGVDHLRCHLLRLLPHGGSNHPLGLQGFISSVYNNKKFNTIILLELTTSVKCPYLDGYCPYFVINEKEISFKIPKIITTNYMGIIKLTLLIKMLFNNK